MQQKIELYYVTGILSDYSWKRVKNWQKIALFWGEWARGKKGAKWLFSSFL